MHALLAIAQNTFREARRNRIFYSILFFAVALILVSVLFTQVTFVAYDRILRDIGFATMNVFGLVMAVFLGVGMVNREIERRTIYTVVTKPVPRWGFIVGKVLGLFLTLLVTLGLMLAAFVFTLVSYRSPVEWVLLQAFYGLMLELMVVVTFAVFTSTWTSSVLSAFFTGSFWVVGHFASDIRFFGSRSDLAWVRELSRIAYAALPDLARFNLKPAVTYLEPVSASHLLALTGYALLWSGVFLLASVLLFRGRDFR